jgi:hypothetical protein
MAGVKSRLATALGDKAGQKKRTIKRQDESGEILQGVRTPLVQVDPADIVAACDTIDPETMKEDPVLRSLRLGSASSLRKPEIEWDEDGKATVTKQYYDALSEDRQPGGIVILKPGLKVFVEVEALEKLIGVMA